MKLTVDPTQLSESGVRLEAERRAKFVRSFGHTMVGYSDGYADGFEHAIKWLLYNVSALDELLDLKYRPDAGMEFTKKHYERYPEDKNKALERFRG